MDFFDCLRRDKLGFWFPITCCNGVGSFKLFIKFVNKPRVNILDVLFADEGVDVVPDQACIGVVGGDTPFLLAVQ